MNTLVKYIACFSTLGMALSGLTFAQSVGVIVEKNQVRLPTGEFLTAADADSETSPFEFTTTVFLGYVSNVAVFEQSLNFAVENRAPDVTVSSALSTFLQGPSITWVPGPNGLPAELAVFPFTQVDDWRSSARTMPVGVTPVMMITTNPISSVTDSDYIAVVSANFVVPTDGSISAGIVSGLGANRFDNAILGSLNSPLTLDQFSAIPEPRVYAAVLGFLALGFVAWRRRKRA
jgi:hypothetical protein